MYTYIHTYQVGSHTHGRDSKALERAARLALASQVVVLGLGLCGNNYGADADAVCDGRIDEAEGQDRSSLALPRAQLELAATVIAALSRSPSNTQLVVFVMAGGSLDLTPILRMCDEAGPRLRLALLWTGYPGQAGGQGIADVITGLHNPASVMPFTLYPKRLAAQVAYDDFALRSGPGRTYRFYKDVPVYAFGFGLSYTRFTLAWSRPPPARAAAGQTLEFSVAVTNTGSRPGDKVVLGFLLPARNASAAAPARQLFAFARVRHVRPGSTAYLSLHLAPGDRTLVAADGVPFVPLGGGHAVAVGADDLVTPLTISG